MFKQRIDYNKRFYVKLRTQYSYYVISEDLGAFLFQEWLK